MLIDVYCDESRQDLLVNKSQINEFNRYVCIGGIWVPYEKRAYLKKEINYLKAKYGIKNEFKWGNVSTNKVRFYTELIDLFFRAENKDILFRCVVIDASEVDDEKYNDSDHELGYYKFYYQLLHNWLTAANEYYIFTDFKTNKDNNRLHELRRIVNRSLHGENVKVLQAIDSEESVILQLQNILMGAVAYKFNYGDRGKSVAKNQLVRAVEEKLGCKIAPTYKCDRQFNIFKISLRGGI